MFRKLLIKFAKCHAVTVWHFLSKDKRMTRGVERMVKNEERTFLKRKYQRKTVKINYSLSAKGRMQNAK